MVADALSRNSLHMSALMVKELELIERFINLSLVSGLTPSGVKLGMLKLTSNILEETEEGQKVDLELVGHLVLISQGKEKDFSVDKNFSVDFSYEVS